MFGTVSDITTFSPVGGMPFLVNATFTSMHTINRSITSDEKIGAVEGMYGAIPFYGTGLGIYEADKSANFTPKFSPISEQ